MCNCKTNIMPTIPIEQKQALAMRLMIESITYGCVAEYLDHLQGMGIYDRAAPNSFEAGVAFAKGGKFGSDDALCHAVHQYLILNDIEGW